jgi:hypothetical protein
MNSPSADPDQGGTPCRVVSMAALSSRVSDTAT